MANVQNKMSTKIALDMVEASQSLKAINTLVRQSETAWKAMANQYASTGDKLKAAESRFNGLTDTIEKQNRKIDALKKAQSELKGNTQETAEKYLRFENQIQSAEAKLSRLTQQQQQAKRALDVQKSGVLEVKSAMETQAKASEALVERLRAEGKEEEANKAKLRSLGQELKGTQTLYDKEVQLLRQIGNESGKTSKEYLEQQTRVNRLGKEIADTTNDLEKFKNELNQDSGKASFLDRIKDKINNVDRDTDHARQTFIGTFTGNLASNIMSNAWDKVKDSIGGAIQAGNEYLKYEDQMQAQWNTLTGSASKGRGMVNVINDLSVSAQNSTEMVNGLASQFYAVTEQKGKTMDLSKAVLTLQDAFGASDDAVQNFGQQYSQMIANGKASGQDFLSITNVFPKFKGELVKYEQELQKNSKLTTKDINDMISKGKISADDMNNVLLRMADKYKDATKNFSSTIPGMERTIRSTMPRLIASVEQPFYKMQNPLLKSVSTWVTDKKTNAEFSKLGKQLASTMNEIMNAFGGKNVNGAKVLDNVIQGITKAVKNFGDMVVQNKDSIKTFFSSFTATGVGTIKVYLQVLKDLAPVIKLVGDVAETHPKLFSTIASSMIIANTSSKIFNSTFGALSGTIGTVVGAGKKAKSLWKDMPKSLTDLASASKKSWGTIKDTVTSSGKTIANAGKTVITKSWNGLKTTASLMASGAKKSFTTMLNGFKLLANGIKLAWATNPLGVVVLAVTAVATAFVALYKHNKKFREWVNGIVKSAQQAFKGVTKWFGDMKDKVTQHAKNMWDKTKKDFSNGATAVHKETSSFADKVSSKWDDLKNGLNRTGTILWNNEKKTWNDNQNILRNYTQTFKDFATGKWGNLRDDLNRTGDSLRNGLQNRFSSMYDTLNRLTGGNLDNMVRQFRNKFNAIPDAISNVAGRVRSASHSVAQAFVKPISNMIQGATRGINWLLGKVGASGIGGFGGISVSAWAKGTPNTRGKNGTHPGGFALVNDSGTKNYREMYQLPTGEIGMFPKQRDLVVPLPEGTSVLNGDDSALLAKSMGVPYYASGIGNFNFDFSSLNGLSQRISSLFSGFGSAFSSAYSTASSAFSSAIDTAGDFIDQAMEGMAHPVQFFESIINRFAHPSGSGVAYTITTKIPHLLASRAERWIKKVLDQFDQLANPGGAGVARWRPYVIKALRMNGLSTSPAMVSKVLRQINTESGGNPHAIGGNDGLADGNATGLMQTKPGTFSAYAFKGHHNIFNGYDNLLAALNYAKHRYGASLSFLGNGHGYANGGLVSNHGLYEVAEGNKPEMIIPLDTMKRSRAWQLVGQVVSYFVGDNNEHLNVKDVNNQEQKRIEMLEDKLDTVTSQLGQLVSLMAQQIQTTKDTAFDKQTLYEVQGQDLALATYQAL